MENTQDGRALPMDYLKRAHDFARDHKLKLHLDGARIFNAAVRLQVPVTDISRYFDSVSICLSKGLGAPVGSLLCSTREFIKEARRWRKVLGGGMRQAGIIAAARIYALENHIDRLQEDHEKAALLDEGLREINGLEIESSALQTNMVFVKPGRAHSSRLPEYLKERGVLINGDVRVRLVTHLDIDKDDIQTVIQAFKKYF
jgi:threonine aldolase